MTDSSAQLSFPFLNEHHNHVGNYDVSKPSSKKEDPQFNRFWLCYPKKQSKGAARRAFEKALNKAIADKIIAGAERYASECRHRDPKIIKTAAKWLNGERWSNDDEAPNPRLFSLLPPPDTATWSPEKWRGVIALAKRNGKWFPDYGPADQIPIDLMDSELAEIVGRLQ